MKVPFGPCALLFLIVGTAGACAPAGPFPSLAMRAEERLVSVGEPRRPIAETPTDPALRQRATALLADGRAGAAAFERDLAAADRAARNPGPMGSESWVSAQQALSRLEAARNETATALAALDRLSTERADMPTSASDQQFILEAMAELERMAADQQRRVDAIRSRISR